MTFEEMTFHLFLGVSKDKNNSGFPYKGDEYEYSKQEPIVKEEKIGRIEPCLCGSGKKYKKCCMRK